MNSVNVKLVVFVSLVFLSNVANADWLAGRYGGCLTEELLDEWTTAQSREDKYALSYLLGNGCVITKAGVQVSLIDMGWTGKVKLRGYGEDGSSTVIWTYVENFIRGDDSHYANSESVGVSESVDVDGQKVIYKIRERDRQRGGSLDMEIEVQLVDGALPKKSEIEAVLNKVLSLPENNEAPRHHIYFYLPKITNGVAYAISHLNPHNESISGEVEVLKYALSNTPYYKLLYSKIAGAPDVFVGGDAACVSKELYSEWGDTTSPFIDGPESASPESERLLQNGCVITEAGSPALLIEMDNTGGVKVRASKEDGSSVIYWTSMSNLAAWEYQGK